MDLASVAPAFVTMAHSIVWCSVATVDASGRPRSRVLHPFWEWDADAGSLVGWVATGPTPVKTANLATSPFASCTYWAPSQDTCTAECRAELLHDDETCTRIWNLFASTPMPLGYDPKIIPGWTSPTEPNFAVLRLDPWRVRVFPGTVLMGQGGSVLDWRA